MLLLEKLTLEVLAADETRVAIDLGQRDRAELLEVKVENSSVDGVQVRTETGSVVWLAGRRLLRLLGLVIRLIAALIVFGEFTFGAVCGHFKPPMDFNYPQTTDTNDAKTSDETSVDI